MKTSPIDETWTVSGTSSRESYDRAVRVEVPERQYLFGHVDTGTGSDPSFDEESDELDEARARLAAQAPAMARLLLKYGNSVECPECLRQAPYEPHAPTCALQAVLRAAGVTEH